MNILQSFLIGLFFVVLAALPSTAQAQQTSLDEHLHIEAPPSWVNVAPVELSDNIPVDTLRSGVFYQLLDNQIRVDENGKRAVYTRYTETVVNKTGVEESSQITIDFDPSYQKLVLHQLSIIRDGITISKLDQASISIFNREDELDSLIYNGDLTLSVILEDVLPGDTIDYSYTRFGANPVYKGVFSYGQGVSWGVPVHKQHLRVLWGKSIPLFVNMRNTDVAFTVSELGQFTEYDLAIIDQSPLDINSETPDWYDPYGVVYLSETQRWSDVVKWALPLYEFGPLHADILDVAAHIQQQHQSLDAQIVAALQYVQERIRYVGLEMGENSHLPTPPHETLAIKYGDCKDKTALLIAILKGLGVKSYPALVDTDYEKTLGELPPGVNLFNHVIVKVEHNNQTFWLDPTLSSQFGALPSLFQPDYGYALVLKPEQNALTPMVVDTQGSSDHIVESYLIPKSTDGTASFDVLSTYRGYEAMRILWRLERDGKQNVQDDYESYYQRSFPELLVSEPLNVEHNETTGVLTLREQYAIPNFWVMGDEHWEADFYASSIRGSVYKPDDVQRTSPMSLTYPNNITTIIELTFEEDGWDFDEENYEDDNPYFAFESAVSFENNVLTLHYQYRAKTDHVPADEIVAYLDARDRLIENTYYGIIKYADQATSDNTEEASPFQFDSEVTEALVIVCVVLLYMSAWIFIFIGWREDARKRPHFEHAYLYPIAMGKFLFMSVVTFGVFDCYWMYRNWKAVQLKTGTKMMPIARGIFALFWVYPLYLQLRKQDEEADSTKWIFAPWLAGLFALGYLVASLVNSVVEEGIWAYVFLFNGLLLLPFVHHINTKNRPSPAALRYNTQWRLRHVIAGILFVPILFFVVAMETHLIPPDTVVTEDQLRDKDLQFFYRKGVLPAQEQIVYFYSDATWNTKADGNGFTENRVFSFWVDEYDGFQSEVATFDTVADIEIEYAEEANSNTIITITRHDGTDFLLFVTNTDKGDKQFVEALRHQWAIKRN